MRLYRRIPLLIALAALLAVPAGANAKVVIGISDNKPEMFGDQRFQDLKAGWARNVVPWDGLRYADDRARLDAWMAGAKTHNVKVLIAFDRSRHGKKGPSAKALAAQLSAFIRRYPGQIKAVTVWNEPNVNMKRRTRDLARMYKEQRSTLRRLGSQARGVKLLAADLVDRPDVNSWASRYLSDLRKQRVPRPRYWGLHNYIDVNNLTYKRTRSFISRVKGEVWLTETGGVVSRNNKSRTKFRGAGVAFQARATKYLLSTMLRKNPRIKYVFIYHWSASESSRTASWDSALVDSNGSARPALENIKSYIRSGRP